MSRQKSKTDYELEEYFRKHMNVRKFIVWKIMQAGDYLARHDNRVVRVVGTPIAMGMGLLVLATKRFMLK